MSWAIMCISVVIVRKPAFNNEKENLLEEG